MQLPGKIVPILEQTVRSPLLPMGFPVEIWRADDHRKWIEAFTELGRLLFASDIPEESLPRAYAQVAYIFDWESQCQFSGWHAFANRAEVMGRVIESYEEVGLEQEAVALKAALKAWIQSNGDVDATTAAYDLHRHQYSIDLDRLEHLVCYFRRQCRSPVLRVRQRDITIRSSGPLRIGTV